MKLSRLHCLLLIMLFGAVLRFSYLSRPPIWGDESATFARVCGTFDELKEELSTVGHAPLHYLIYWTIAQRCTMTPFMMRLVPAICGTLMIPAMYWLASQLVAKRTATLVALFTACSAWLLNYSRDAKMYQELWLFVTLNVASLLWWVRTRGVVSSLTWVATGLVMTALHSVGMLVLPIELLIVLTARHRSWMSFGLVVGFFVIGVGMMLVEPYWYYTKFTSYVKDVYESGQEMDWNSTGVQWVGRYNNGRQGVDLAAFGTTAFLYNWEWPRESDLPSIPGRAFWWLRAAGATMFMLLAVGIFPWRTMSLRLIPSSDTPGEGQGGGPTNAAAPPPQPSPGVPEDGESAPGWRSGAWVTAWIILPAYGMYCASMPDAASPIDWIRYTSQHWWMPCILLLTVGAWWLSGASIKSIVGGIGIIAVLLGLCMLIRLAIRQPFPDSVWMPRYLGFLWPAFAIVVCVLLMRLPTRPLRWTAIAVVIGVNLALHAVRVFADSEPPTDRMVADAIADQQSGGATKMYYCLARRPEWRLAPGTGMLDSVPARYYFAVMTHRHPVSPREVRFTFSSEIPFWDDSASPGPTIAADVSSNSQLKRIFVWERVDPTAPATEDDLLKRLPQQQGWKPVGQEIFHVRDHWTWRQMQTIRRRAYERP